MLSSLNGSTRNNTVTYSDNDQSTSLLFSNRIDSNDKIIICRRYIGAENLQIRFQRHTTKTYVFSDVKTITSTNSKFLSLHNTPCRCGKRLEKVCIRRVEQMCLPEYILNVLMRLQYYIIIS